MTGPSIVENVTIYGTLVASAVDGGHMTNVHIRPAMTARRRPRWMPASVQRLLLRLVTTSPEEPYRGFGIVIPKDEMP